MKVKDLLLLVIIISAVLISCDEEEELPMVPDGYINGVVLRDSVVLDSFALAFKGNLNEDKYSKDWAWSAITDSLRVGVDVSGKWSFWVRVKLPGPVGMGLFDIEENAGTYFADSLGKTFSAAGGELTITHSNKIKERNGRKDFFVDGKISATFGDSLQSDTLRVMAGFKNIRVRAE